MTAAARIGEPRVYPGAEIPILYPGEQALAQVDLVALQQSGEIRVVGWTVEPMPGWWGAWLRWRYRLWGQWFCDGPPRIEGNVTTTPVRAPRDV